MKKIALLLFLLTVVVYPMYTPANASVKTSQSKLAYLGYFESGGVQYDLYGTWPDITSVVPSSGTVSSFDGYMYIGGPTDPFPTAPSTFIEVNGSNGLVQYNGVVFM